MIKKGYRTPRQIVQLKEVDGAEIISLMDNSVDFLSTIEREEVQQVRKWVKESKGDDWIKEHFLLPVAEHGFSMLIRLLYNGTAHSLLFDTGGSSEGMITNANRMGLNLSEIESVVLSHGHYDHFSGLLTVLRVVNKQDLPIIVHEDMFKTRGVADTNGTIRKHPDFPTDYQVKPARYIRTKRPYLTADKTALVTGEIPRETDFEKGFPQHRVLANGQWQPDPWIWDDRAIVINVKQKGLVVISDCAHAGIINRTHYAQQITGTDSVFAIMGGFHLAGKECEPRISQTVEKLKLINPNLLVPSHCTGWKGVCAIAEAMPHAFVWNSVGNLYRLKTLKYEHSESLMR
jgi:7,8-dihydropterin-6-yl-methyl-4-(beta-D-ribofuranosyl)aminobenzene 5'-phosphate synthase